jgi:hypothetical protein
VGNKWIEMQAIAMYESGFRSVLLYSGESEIHAFSNSEGYHPVEEPDIWHALRAYQDEQRKKGEPILVSPMGALDASKWYHRSYKTQDTTFEFRFGTHSHNDSKPWINIFSAKNYHGVWCHARFTNFRWRPGHGPKHAHDINVASIQKGGSNG